MEGRINIKLILKIIVYVGGVLISIYLVLIASGYKFDSRQKRFVQTGAIHLSSNIKDDLKIYINGKLRSKKLPLKVKYLLPGSYSVVIEKDGYRKWQKNLEVKPGYVSDETDIILFFQEFTEQELNNTEGILGFTLSDSRNEIMFWTDSKVYYQKIENGEPEEVYKLTNEKIIDVNANEGLDDFIIQAQDVGGRDLFYYCNSRPCQKAFDLNRGLKLNFEYVKLTFNDKYPILASAEDNLYLLSSSYENHYIDSNVIDFGFFDDHTIYSRSSEKKIEIVKKDIDGTETEVIFSEEVKGKMANEAYSIFIDKEEDKLYLINKSGNLLEYNKGKKEFISLNLNATGLIFDNTNYLLIQNNNELWVQGRVFPTDKKESVHLVARYSSNIFDPGWLQKSNYILFIREGKLRAVHIKGSNETELYQYKGIVNNKYSSISYTQIIILDQGKIKNIKITERGSLIDLW